MWDWSTVECVEENGTRSETYTSKDMACEVTLRVSSANKHDLILDLMNNGVWPDPALTQPPAVKQCVATPDLTISVPGTTAQSFEYSEYLVKVSYSYDESFDVVAETLEPDAEFTRLDHTFFRWKATGAPLSPGEAPGVLTPKLKLTRQFFNRTSVPAELLLAGHVHNANYTSPTFGITFPAHSLMMIPQPVATKRSTTGGGYFDYGCSFLYNANLWNKYFKVDTGTYDSIVLPNGSDFLPHTPSNLSALLA